MNSDDHLRRVEARVWVTIGLIAAGLVGCALTGRFEIDFRSFLLPVALTGLLTIGGWLYRSLRNEARLGAILANMALFMGFAAVAAPLSYVAAAASLPLQDAMLNEWDLGLGFDWTGVVTFTAQHPLLEKLLRCAYASFVPQLVTTAIALGATGQLARLSRFIVAFVITTLVTIAISAVVPATGPWLFLGLQPGEFNGFLPVSASSWPAFLGLRDGTLHAIAGANSEGIITFPSLHASLAVLFAAALWGIRTLRWVGLGWNAMMLIATPAYGSHYFVDVLAGIAIAAACWIAAAHRVSVQTQSVVEACASPPIVPSMNEHGGAPAHEERSAASQVAQA